MATEAQIITAMTFVSRQDVEALRTVLRQPFDNAEELAADDMDQTAFMALVSLDAAITNYLVVAKAIAADDRLPVCGFAAEPGDCLSTLSRRKPRGSGRAGEQGRPSGILSAGRRSVVGLKQ